MPRYELPKKPVLIVDTRERTPLDFDGDDDFAEVIHRKLDSGDYSLDGAEHIVTIERKAGVDELFNNFSSADGRRRIMAEIDRMPPVRFFVIEQTWEEAFDIRRYHVAKRMTQNKKYMPRSVVLKHMWDLMLDHDVHVIFAGNRAKDVTKRLLLQVWERHRRGGYKHVSEG